MLETKPEFVFLVCFHKAGGVVAVVELVGAPIWIPCLTHDNNVGFQTEWIGKDGYRANVDVGVIAGSLAGRGAVKVPFRQLIGTRDRLEESL